MVLESPPITLVDPWLYIRQALFRALRSNLVLKDELLGDWSESVAPQGTPFPRGVIQLHYSPFEYDWSGFVSISGVDVGVFAKTQGEAARLNQLVFTTLQDARLDVAGQTSLTCRRVSSFSLEEAAPDGTESVFQQGGIYAVLAPQSNPTLRTLSTTLTSTIGS
jgi:hypothetical protein